MTACKWEQKMLQLLQQQLLLLLQDCRQLVITQQKKNKKKKTGLRLRTLSRRLELDRGGLLLRWGAETSIFVHRLTKTWQVDCRGSGGGYLASLLDGAQLPGGGWRWRILLARRVPLRWTLCCSHDQQSHKRTFFCRGGRKGKKKRKKKSRHNSLPGRAQDYFVFFSVFSIHRVQVWSSAAQLRPGVAWIRSDEEWGPSNSFQDSVGCLPSAITWLLGFLHHRLCWWRSFAQKLDSFPEFGEEMTTRASLSWISKQEKKKINNQDTVFDSPH